MLKKTEDHHAGKLSPKPLLTIFFCCISCFLVFQFFSAHPLVAFYFIMILHVYFIKTNDPM